MLTPEAVENYLVRSGFTEPSLSAIRPKYDRIIRGMTERGFDDLSGATAANELTLTVQQMRRREARDATAEHNLRNLTGVRRSRRWK